MSCASFLSPLTTQFTPSGVTAVTFTAPRLLDVEREPVSYRIHTHILSLNSVIFVASRSRAASKSGIEFVSIFLLFPVDL